MQCFRVPSSVKSKIFVLIAIATIAAMTAACGTDVAAPNGDLSDSDTQRLSDEDFDGITPLRARTQDLQLSVAPIVRVDASDFGPRWSMQFEANRPLSSVLSYGTGGELGRPILLDEYRFEIALDRAELKYVLADAKLYLLLHASAGERREFAGMVQLAPRFVESQGSMTIWIDPGVSAVETGTGLVLRASATTASKIETLSVFTDVDADPSLVATDGKNRWVFEWQVDRLVSLLGFSAETVHLIGRDAQGEDYALSAQLGVVVGELGLTTGDAERTWPSFR